MSGTDFNSVKRGYLQLFRPELVHMGSVISELYGHRVKRSRVESANFRIRRLRDILFILSLWGFI
jgi:hypothetical protein